MSIKVKCPGCGKTVKAPDKYVGKSAKCPGCGGPISFTVPHKKQFDPADILSESPATPPNPPPRPPSVPFESLGEAHERMSGPTTATTRSNPRPRPGLHKQRVFVSVIAIVGMLGTFLPWLHAPLVGTMTGMAGIDGKIILCLFAVTLAGALAGGSTPMRVTSFFLCSIPALLAAAFAAYKLFDFPAPSNSGNEFADGLTRAMSPGIGLFVIVAAGLAAVIVPFFIADKPSEN